MQDYFTFVLGNLFSCFIISFIVFQHMNEVYIRTHNNRSIYILLQVVISGSILFVNMFNRPIANLISWLIMFGLMVTIFYYDYEKKILRRIFEITVLFLILAVCEAIGYIILEFIIWKFQIDHIPPLILECLKVTFSKLSILVLYYFCIIRIWKFGKQAKMTSAQYIVYGIIIIYSVLNLSLILISVTNVPEMDSGQMILLMINMFGIVFVDLFFLYFTKFTEQSGQLKLKLRLLEQQSNIQYKYYAAQEDKYNESVAILHDVNKHLKMIEGIFEVEKANRAKEYTKEIQTILEPLVPKKHTNNPILNILIDDKIRSASVYDIKFILEIGNINLEFMKPIEITTVFGNLLDNAIEACQTVKRNRYIKMRLETYNEFIAVRIENSSQEIAKWINGKPISAKGKNHGIGLINVENTLKRYNGNMLLAEKNQKFCCDIIFSR